LTDVPWPLLRNIFADGHIGNGLLTFVGSRWHHNQQIEVAVGGGVAPGIGAKQNYFEGLKLLNDALCNQAQVGCNG